MDRRTRRWTGAWGTGLALGLAVIAGTRPTARADITIPDPPKSKRVPVVETLDWGAFADRVARRHVVQAGETLRAIAAAHCGDAARWKAVADANPAVVAAPDRIRAGDRLWLPPARSFAPAAPAADADPKTTLEPWYDAFAMRWVGRRTRGVGDRLSPEPSPPAVGALLLVPHGDTPALLAALAGGDVRLDDPILARALQAGFGTDNLVHADEPTARIEVTTRLTGRDGSSVTMSRDTRRVDASGRVVKDLRALEPRDVSGFGLPVPRPSPRTPVPPPAVADEAPPPAPPPAPPSEDGDAPSPPAEIPGRWPAWLGLLVAALGGAILGGLAIARRRRSPGA